MHATRLCGDVLVLDEFDGFWKGPSSSGIVPVAVLALIETAEGLGA